MSINTLELHRRVEQAIADAEQGTSAELRVHLEENCNEDPLDRASFIFEKLEMHQTAERNGVLIYVAFKDRKLAIIGDAGIHAHLHQETWTATKDEMIRQFALGSYEKGLCDAIAAIGNKLSTYFPYREGDRNELSNTVTTHNIQ
jgi:uncharacterized membrane protein